MVQQVAVDLLTLGAYQHRPVCKGHHYTYLENDYISTRGEIVSKVTFRPLKRMSCPGCEQCGGLMDMLASELEGGMIPYPRGLTYGATVILTAVNDGRCFEDIYDEYHLEFTRYEEG